MNSVIDDIKSRIEAIRSAHTGNLMARHFSAEYVDSLGDDKRERLINIIRTGLDNPDSQMGAYALHSDDYDQFAPLLVPMIRDYHAIPEGQPIAQTHDWSLGEASANLTEIDSRLKTVSMRVRTGRNVARFPLPGAMSKAQRIEFENIAIDAFSAMPEGQYLSLTPGSPHEIDPDTYARRVASHQMFKDMSGDPYLASAGISADWPHGRGMYVSTDEDFLIWVGEEDHLRIIAMGGGGDLKALFSRLHVGLERLTALLPAFAHSDRFGFITSCPTNLGTAMRASLHLPLPILTEGGSNLKPVKKAAAELGLAVRGAGGEHSDAGQDGKVDISPNERLGITESDIMRRLYDGVARLWTLENAL